MWIQALIRTRGKPLEGVLNSHIEELKKGRMLIDIDTKKRKVDSETNQLYKNNTKTFWKFILFSTKCSLDFILIQFFTFRMALVSAKDVDKFNVKLVEGGNSKEFALNSNAALAPKHEDLTQLAASIATGMYKFVF